MAIAVLISIWTMYKSIRLLAANLPLTPLSLKKTRHTLKSLGPPVDPTPNTSSASCRKARHLFGMTKILSPICTRHSQTCPRLHPMTSMSALTAMNSTRANRAKSPSVHPAAPSRCRSKITLIPWQTLPFLSVGIIRKVQLQRIIINGVHIAKQCASIL